MEVKAQSMHEEIRVDLGKFRNLRAWKCLENLSQIRKGGGYQISLNGH